MDDRDLDTNSVFNVFIVIIISLLLFLFFAGWIRKSEANYGLTQLERIRDTAQAWNGSAYNNDNCNEDGFQLYNSINPPDYYYGAVIRENNSIKLYNAFDWYGGPYQWGDLLTYTNTGQLFLGYDACYGAKKMISSKNIIVVDPTNIQSISNNRYCLPYPYIYLEFPQNNAGGSWAGYCLNMDTGYIYWVGFGDSYNMQYPLPCELGGECPTPIPTPSPSPIPTLIPTPPPPTPPPPTPLPQPQFTVVPNVEVGDIEGTFSYDETTGQGTITVTVSLDQEMVTLPEEIYDVGTGTMSSGLPLVEGGETDDLETALNSYLAAGSSTVGAVASTWFQPVVNWILDMVFHHPVMAYFNEIDFQLSDEFCEVSIDLWGKTITFGFCDLTDELAVLRLIIVGVAGVYAVFIVLKGD